MLINICNEFIYHEIFNDVNELFVKNLFITKYSTMLMNYLIMNIFITMLMNYL